MKDYDWQNPLIFIHVPKTAGTAVQKVFQLWYGTNFQRHYYDEVNGKLPPKLDLNGLHKPTNPVLLYGHFNRLRGFGVDQYYPEVKQFLTVLRDPFEMAVSHYFFARRNGANYLDKSRIPQEELSAYLSNAKPNMLNHFPRVVTKENYKGLMEEFFLDIGISEYLEESMYRMAGKLGKEFSPQMLGVANRTERDQVVAAEFRDRFEERNQLEFLVYRHALQRFLAARPIHA